MTAMGTNVECVGEMVTKGAVCALEMAMMTASLVTKEVLSLAQIVVGRAILNAMNVMAIVRSKLNVRNVMEKEKF